LAARFGRKNEVRTVARKPAAPVIPPNKFEEYERIDR
jgi:hypothetical protein